MISWGKQNIRGLLSLIKTLTKAMGLFCAYGTWKSKAETHSRYDESGLGEQG